MHRRKIVEIVKTEDLYTGNKPEVIATSYDKMKVKKSCHAWNDVRGAVLSMEETDHEVFPAM